MIGVIRMNHEETTSVHSDVANHLWYKLLIKGNECSVSPLSCES